MSKRTLKITLIALLGLLSALPALPLGAVAGARMTKECFLGGTLQLYPTACIPFETPVKFCIQATRSTVSATPPTYQASGAFKITVSEGRKRLHKKTYSHYHQFWSGSRRDITYTHGLPNPQAAGWPGSDYVSISWTEAYHGTQGNQALGPRTAVATHVMLPALQRSASEATFCLAPFTE